MISLGSLSVSSYVQRTCGYKKNFFMSRGSILLLIFARKNSSAKAREKTEIPSIFNLEKKPWFMDLLLLSNDELIRIYSTITNDYDFAKNAWYFGHITKTDIKEAILVLFQLRTIEIAE